MFDVTIYEFKDLLTARVNDLTRINKTRDIEL